ncbi:MAG TPA: hypothetical protein DEO70_04980 [Bacteroidales bacterium]|nr:MAG: hypothetical protein A2X11_11650 [Bacteroidetes bacterium GWE2_42_24]OFY25504.1 MAG: hypothetical protein A2X09_06940 [Bacteroidetes bacterium GWF2_43_11]HBZ66171.1 hypothetical protein [Bacteroidales bacterium]
MTQLTICAVQHDIVWEDPLANFAQIEKLLTASQNSANLIILPEFFAVGFSPLMAGLADTASGTTLEWMKRLASIQGAVVAGSVPVLTAKGVVNRFYWVNKEGKTAWYDKLHLFSIGGENQHLVRGYSRTRIETDGWKFMPQVCYDLRFPVFARNEYNNGVYAYDVLIYTANWPASRTHHWRSLLIARAIENQCFVIGVNRTGTDGTGLIHQGNTMVIDFMGNILKEAIGIHPQTVEAVLDYESLDGWRKRFLVAEDWDKISLPGWNDFNLTC